MAMLIDLADAARRTLSGHDASPTQETLPLAADGSTTTHGEVKPVPCVAIRGAAHSSNRIELGGINMKSVIDDGVVNVHMNNFADDDVAARRLAGVCADDL